MADPDLVTLDSESELEKLKKSMDMPLISREFALMKSERDVMELLSSTWVTNQGLGSMKKTFGMISNASASKTSTLDGLAARIEKMQLNLRKAPGGAECSSQVSGNAGGKVKGGRRSTASGTGNGGLGAGGDVMDSLHGNDDQKKANTLPPVPEKAPSEMTATERVEFELARESDHLMTTCTACGVMVPRERYNEHRSSCVAAARRRRKVTEQMGLLESPAQISPCVICGFFFENRNMDSHYRSCLRSKVADKSVVDNLLPAEAPVLPRPPTHIEVSSFTCESVTLTWREPLFRGFMQLTDHVIQVTEVGLVEDLNSLVALRKRDAAERAKQAKVKKEKEEEKAAKLERKKAKRARRRKNRLMKMQFANSGGSNAGDESDTDGEASDTDGESDIESDTDNTDESGDEGTGASTEGGSGGHGASGRRHRRMTRKKKKKTIRDSGGSSGSESDSDNEEAQKARKKKDEIVEDPKLSAPAENRVAGRTWNVATTSFTLVEPLAANGFTVVGLSGDMKYKFAVQSVSAAGPSAFSTEMVEVVTLPPIAPGPCIMFSEDKLIMLGDPTTSLALRWLCPDSGGGSDIVDYEISFDLSVVRAKVTDIKFGMRENKRMRLRTGYIEPSPSTSDQSDKVTRQGDKYRGPIYRGEVRYILRALEGGCPYRNIEVRAVNRAGFLSKHSDRLESIVLQSPPREEILLKEYRRALLENKEAIALSLIPKEPHKGGGNTEAFGGNFLDSSFYYAGSFQRFPRSFAIEKLRVELEKLGVARRAAAILTEVEGMGEDGESWELPSLSNNTSMSSVDNDSVLSDKYNGTADLHLLKAVKAKHTGGSNTYEEMGQDDNLDAAEEFVTRSKQFRYKIRQLRHLAEFLQTLAQRNRDTVLGLIPEIRRLESKARSIEVEHGRVSTFRGMYLDSDSLTGGRSQRFRKQDLLELLNEKVEELMDRVQSRKIDLIKLNQESIARIKASVKAWDAYQERASAYFKHRADRTRKLKKWPKNRVIMRRWFQHWLWMTATKVLHVRALDTIFRNFYHYYAIRSFNKFVYQCFRSKPSRLRGGGQANSPPKELQLSARQLTNRLTRGQSLSASRKRNSIIIQSPNGEDDSEDEEEDDDENEKKKGNSLGELGEIKKYLSPGDEELVNVLKGRESLLDELRSQVARTSHFTSVQKLIDGSGDGAATFFLAEGHRHLPNAAKLKEINKKKEKKLQELKYGKSKFTDYDDAELQQKQDEAEGKMNPKQELIAGLVKCGVTDPLDLATTLFTGNQISWGDISWAFQSDGVGGLKAMLLDVGIDVTSISKIVARFIKERFEGANAPTTSSKTSGKPKVDPGTKDDDDDDDDQLASGMAKSPSYMLSDDEIRNLPDESLKVAIRWMDDEEDLGSYDLALQRIISLLNIKDYEAADQLCKLVHAKCPAPKGLDITGGLPSGAKEPAKAPLPCSEEEINETLYLSLSQQSMIWLQQAKAQRGLFLSGKTEAARNKGQIGAELEYALFCIDEAIDRAKGWAAVDEKEGDDEDEEDEEEAAKKEKESEEVEAEELAAAKAAGITFRKKEASIASKAKKRRDEIKRKTLQGEEWSSDALLFWAFEVKGDILCELEAHEEAIQAFKLGLRHLLLLRKKRAIHTAAQVAKATQEALGAPAEKVKEAVAAAITNAAILADSEDAGAVGKKGESKKRVGGVAEEATLCAKIAKQYRRSNDDLRAKKWEEKSSQIKNRNKDKRKDGQDRLDHLFEKLLDDAKAELASDVMLERCSNKVPEIRLRRLANLEEVEDARDALAVAMEDAGGRSAQLIGAQADLEFAIKSEADTVESSAFGAKATYPVEEFRVLVERQVEALGKEQSEALARVRKQHLAINNLLDEIEDLEAVIRVEAGPLMQRAVQRQHLIRCMCANASNLMANDVSGKASGGVSLIAVGVDNYAAVYDIETGALMQVLFGERNKTGERPNGHAAKITAIFFLAYRLYTGDHDGIIFVWNVSDGRGGLSAKKKKKSKKEAAQEAKEGVEVDVGSSVFTPASGVVTSAQCVLEVLDDHDNSITAISADEEKMISASADLTIKVWNAEVGEGDSVSYDLLFTLRGHAKSVNFIGIGDFTFATGDAAGQVRVWELMKSAKEGGVDEGTKKDGNNSDSSEEVAKYSRCRCILKVRHNRSEDAPEQKSVELSADEALAERLRSLHSDGNFKMTAVQEAAMLSRDGANMTRECEALKTKKFLSRDPGPAGRIRTHAITCLEYYGAELTCGDAHGKVFIWNISEKRCMWDIQAHQGRVSALQVDAVRVVTGGADGLVRIFDIMTGRAVQSFQAHNVNTPVLIIQFDALQLLTGGADGRLMRWLWSTAAEGAQGEKLTKHFVSPGDSLPIISVKYGTPLKNILEWNNLRDGRDMYGGMSLIVAKEVAGDKIKNHYADGRESSGKNNSTNKDLRNRPTSETSLFHPLYGLKTMEQNIYKGRAPRKSEENGDDATSVLEKARQMSKKSGVIDKIDADKAKKEAEEKKRLQEEKDAALTEDDIQEIE